MRKGVGVFRIDLPKVLADESNDLTPAMRQLVRDLWGQLQQFEERIRARAGSGGVSSAPAAHTLITNL